MGIEYKKGDILSVTEGVIVHQVNCGGVMGAGLAKQIKEKYPVVYSKYRNYCKSYSGEDLLGDILSVDVSNQLTIINLFGQVGYFGKFIRNTSYDALYDGFIRVGECVYMSTPIHMPKIGCGLGGGNWNIVEQIIKATLMEHDITIWEYA